MGDARAFISYRHSDNKISNVINENRQDNTPVGILYPF